jgi:hypothetical protein
MTYVPGLRVRIPVAINEPRTDGDFCAIREFFELQYLATDQSISMTRKRTRRRSIIYCAKRWPNRAVSTMPGVQQELR